MSKDALDPTLGHWERILAAVEANRKDLPYLEPYRVQLGADIECVKALQDRRTALREEALQATQDLKALVARGRDLASRIQAGARAHYGPRSGKLEEFGVRFPRTKRSLRRLNRGARPPGTPEAPPGNS
jgi:hypothetical protein